MTKVKGGVPIRRVPRTPSVVIQAGQRVFHKLPDGTYEPATITLRAVVQNVTNPRYQWGRILNGNFRTYNVTLEAMTITPAHAGVVAVRVEGDNIPGYIQATESISIVEDGAPAVQYKIVVSQLGRVVTSIPCDDQGNPKIYYQATASLYKIIGSKEEPCGDFLCVIAYYKGDSIVKSDISPGYVDNYTFIVEGDCDSVRIGFSDGENVIVETTVPKVCDGSQGIPGSSGYTYRPRGMFTPGDTYVYNDMYRDIVLSWFNSRLHTFRVKVKGSSVTVLPTSSNGDDNWEVANELEFVATDLLLAQNAIVNLLQGNEVRVLDGNGIATAGMSGSGSGDSGIRFYAGSDDPQTAPFRVSEKGKFVATDGDFIGKVETSKNGKRVIISPDTSSLLMVDSLGNKALEIRFPTWASGSTSAFGSYITIKSHRTAMQVGESLPWDSTIVISDEEISMEGTYNEYGVSGTVKRKVSINPYGISFYKNGSLKKTYNNE